jgi:hypothetical protein
MAFGPKWAPRWAWPLNTFVVELSGPTSRHSKDWTPLGTTPAPAQPFLGQAASTGNALPRRRARREPTQICLISRPTFCIGDRAGSGRPQQASWRAVCAPATIGVPGLYESDSRCRGCSQPRCSLVWHATAMVIEAYRDGWAMGAAAASPKCPRTRLASVESRPPRRIRRRLVRRRAS